MVGNQPRNERGKALVGERERSRRRRPLRIFYVAWKEIGAQKIADERVGETMIFSPAVVPRLDLKPTIDDGLAGLIAN